MEGGQAVVKQNFDPFMYVQSPFAHGDPVPDARIKAMFKKQMKIDFIFIRFVMLAGNFFLLITDLLNKEINQMRIEAIENIIISFFMIGLQGYILKTWDAQQLPFKMKDTKSNYLFKPYRYPDNRKIEDFLRQD